MVLKRGVSYRILFSLHEFIHIDTIYLVNGNYKLLIDLSYEGQVEPASAEAEFSVGEGFLFEYGSRVFIFVLVCVFVSLIFLIILFLFKGITKKRGTSQ